MLPSRMCHLRTAIRRLLPRQVQQRPAFSWIQYLIIFPRPIPVGLVIADTDRDENVNFYNCQSDPDDEYENAEWLGLNSYVMCDGTATTYDEALGLKFLQKTFDGYKYSIPVLMTEFGCLSDSFPEIDGYQAQRTFLQARWMMNRKELRNVFAGAFAFEYSIEKANAGQESPFPFRSLGFQNYGIGYFEPKYCDDVDIPCEYHPLPSFHFLKDAYNYSSGDLPLTTVDSFSIPRDRTGRTECPKSFGPLSSFTWKSDSVPFSRCPKDAHFVCPAHFVEPATSSSDGGGFFDGLIRFSFWVTIVAVICLRKHGGEKDAEQWTEAASSSDESINYSTALLSLKALDKRYFYYDVIDTESSSDELDRPRVVGATN